MADKSASSKQKRYRPPIFDDADTAPRIIDAPSYTVRMPRITQEELRSAPPHQKAAPASRYQQDQKSGYLHDFSADAGLSRREQDKKSRYQHDFPADDEISRHQYEKKSRYQRDFPAEADLSRCEQDQKSRYQHDFPMDGDMSHYQTDKISRYQRDFSADADMSRSQQDEKPRYPHDFSADGDMSRYQHDFSMDAGMSRRQQENNSRYQRDLSTDDDMSRYQRDEKSRYQHDFSMDAGMSRRQRDQSSRDQHDFSAPEGFSDPQTGAMPDDAQDFSPHSAFRPDPQQTAGPSGSPPRRRKRPLTVLEPDAPPFGAVPSAPSAAPRRRRRGTKRGMRRIHLPRLSGKWPMIAAIICVCAFFFAATLRILMIPTQETVYVFDGSQAEYVLTDGYIPPATMPVVSNVAWDGGDALALLETAKLIGSSDATLLAQADAPGATNLSSTVRVCIASTGQVVDMEREEYLIGVVAAEGPASYNVEAIKAQAVAARTYTVRRMASLGGAPDGKGGDVCTSAAHCQAYYSTDELRARWGGEFDKYYNIVRDAVYATRGLIMTYDGAPINAFYHANSGGRTANCEDVFVQALPYLRSVDSPGESAYSSYESTKTLSRAEFASTLSSKTGAAIDPANLENLVRVTQRTDCGRVYRIEIAGTEYKGTTFQGWFSLRSTNITITMDAQNVTMTVLGYGHGVGMSQTGANAMAGAGNSYATILTHYYTGVSIEPYQ